MHGRPMKAFPTISVMPASTTTCNLSYSVNGCSIDESSTVTVNPVPTATISGGGVICSNSAATVQLDFTGAGPRSVVYNDGTTNNAISNRLHPLHATSAYDNLLAETTPCVCKQYRLFRYSFWLCIGRRLYSNFASQATFHPSL